MKKAIALLYGILKDQFSILWDYVHEIDKTNLGTSIYTNFTNNRCLISHTDFKESTYVLLLVKRLSKLDVAE